jgi:excisionase family DNA binding protein
VAKEETGDGYMSEDQGSVLTIDELAEYLKISKSTLYKLAKDRKIPGQKVGRHWRFHRWVIDRWLEEGGREPKSGRTAPR